jgi:amino acid transporter
MAQGCLRHTKNVILSFAVSTRVVADENFMKTIVLICINGFLITLFIVLLRKPGILTYYASGRVWLTWFAVAIITLMDELTSVFYAPAEAYRFIGPSAIIFIAFTAIFIHYMTTRLVEIAEILEHHRIFGGGVYSFSYLVLGPTVSFVAVSSIMVDYILTACLSAVSAVENATSFFAMPHYGKMITSIVIVWAVAGLNIVGIRENARFTFSIFALAAVVFLNLIVSGVLSLDSDSILRLQESVSAASQRLQTGSMFTSYGIFIASVASCVLAYSGVESVLQTAGLVRTWREIGKSYIFLACTVGVVTPIVAALALSAPIDFAKHEGDLITHYATLVNGVPFGVIVAVLASLALIMAVNTAFVASSELMERVAERYGFHWLIKTNRKQSLYRIHLANAVFFSFIILITAGSQMILADMYAIGLVASFCINMGSLIIYRYFMGTKEVIHFNTSRAITLVMFLIFVSCFAFLAWMKPHGTELWATITGIVLVAGLLVAQKRAPEIKEIAQTDSQMDMILHLAESTKPDVHIFFRRPREKALADVKSNEVYVTFYSPRQGAPAKLSPNHFRFAAGKRSVYQHIVALLKVVEYELSDRQVVVHFGWPLSSWIDRLSIGVMVFNIMRLPRQFSGFTFNINYPGRPYKSQE